MNEIIQGSNQTITAIATISVLNVVPFDGGFKVRVLIGWDKNVLFRINYVAA